MRMRLLVMSVVTAAVLSGVASAQARGAGGFSHAPSVTPGFAGFPVTSPARPGPAFPHRHSTPVLFYSDLGYEPVTTQPVSIVVVQPPAPAAAPIVEEPRTPAKPLLLELHGDRWEQVDNFQMTANSVRSRDSKTAPQAQNAPVDTLLIFRDGRSEITSAYAVIGDVLYEQSNYWSSGAWTKKIRVADLDLPATMKANQQRGSIFRLPAGPNEVVLQP